MYRLIGVLLVVLCSPVAAVEYRVVHAVDVAGEPACMPAATRAPNGDVVVAFSTVWEPHPPGGTLKLVRSTDGGRTWSEPRVLFQPTDPLGGVHLGCGMTTMRDGTIALPWRYQTVHKRDNVESGSQRPSRIYRTHDHRNVREVHLWTSKDNGESWQRRMIYKAKRPEWITAFGRIVELPNGDILLSAYWGKFNGDQDGNEWRAHGFLHSSDGGQTWTRREMPRSWNSEISSTLLADGTLLAILRNNGTPDWPRRIFGMSRSSDGGRTWSEPLSTDVRGKMPDLVQLPSGRLLMGVGAEGLTDGIFIYRDEKRPSFCTLFTSDDGGEHWKPDVVFAQSHPGSPIVPSDSPVFVPLDDGRIFCVMQALDRRDEHHPLAGFSKGMSLIGNILEPVAR